MSSGWWDGGSFVRQPSHHHLVALPRLVEHLVRGPVEVDAIDVICRHGGLDHRGEGDRVERGRGLDQSDGAREVNRLLGLVAVRQLPAAKERASRQEVVAVSGELTCDRELTGLMSVELEGSEEGHILDGREPHLWLQQQRRLGERLDAHDARQHGRAVDLMIVEEGLLGRIERRNDGEAATHWPSDYVREQRRSVGPQPA